MMRTRLSSGRIPWKSQGNPAGRCSRSTQLGLVFQEPLVGLLDAIPQADLCTPPQCVQARDVEQLAWCAVGLAGVVHDPALEAGDFLHQFGQLPDADVLADPNIDDARVVVGFGQEDRRRGHVVHMQELASRSPGSPHDNLRVAAQLRFMELADQRWKHVGVGEVKVVARAVKVGRHQAGGIEAVLLAVGLAQLDPGDLGDRVPLIGWLQRAGEQGSLADGLLGELRIDAGRPEEGQLLRTMAVRGVDYVVLDLETPDKGLRGIGVIGVNTANLRRREDDHLGLFLGEEGLHGSGVTQIQDIAPGQEEVVVAKRLQTADDRRADQAPMPCNENTVLFFHGTSRSTWGGGIWILATSFSRPTHASHVVILKIPHSRKPPMIPVILSGGSGTRLWPLSREAYPKQFLPLLGGDSLLQATWRRVAPLATQPPIVVANVDHRFMV